MRHLAASLLLLSVFTGSAHADQLAPGQKALLLLRVLAYDRNLKGRAGEEVRIAVVFRPGIGTSEHERDSMVRAIGEVVSRAVVAGLPVRVKAVPFQDASRFGALLAELRPAAMFVTAGLEPEGEILARVAKERQVPSVCGSRDLVERGLAIGLVDRGDRAGVVLNLKAAAAQGADLDSALAHVAERVD